MHIIATAKLKASPKKKRNHRKKQYLKTLYSAKSPPVICYCYIYKLSRENGKIQSPLQICTYIHKCSHMICYCIFTIFSRFTKSFTVHKSTSSPNPIKRKFKNFYHSTHTLASIERLLICETLALLHYIDKQLI